MDRLAQRRDLLPENLRQRRLFNKAASLEDPQGIAALDLVMLPGIAAQNHPAMVFHCQSDQCIHLL
jgi:hypothetical protein